MCTRTRIRTRVLCHGTRVLEYSSVLVYYVRACSLPWYCNTRVHVRVLEYFDKVSGALEADTARVRAARRVALCGVAASLVKQQGYVLAQIVFEINAPDLAAGDVGGAGVVAEGNDGCRR